MICGSGFTHVTYNNISVIVKKTILLNFHETLKRPLQNLTKTLIKMFRFITGSSLRIMNNLMYGHYHNTLDGV